MLNGVWPFNRKLRIKPAIKPLIITWLLERVCGSIDNAALRDPLRKEHMQEARDAVSS